MYVRCLLNFSTQADCIIFLFFVFIDSLLSLQHIESRNNAQEYFLKK